MSDYSVEDHIAYNMGFKAGQETQAARIAELEVALQDMAKHVWRGDWDKLKPETRALLDEKK